MKTALKRTWVFVKILFVRLRFIFAFIVIGLIVGNWGLIMNYVDRLTRPGADEEAVAGEPGKYEWYCPMHPSVVRDRPNQKCPICGMPLARRERGEKTALPAGILSRLELSESRIRQAGIATTEVAYRTLVRELRTVGFITYDERRVKDLSARVAGRADELYVDFTGVRVREGDPVYKLYSPDLVTTQEEYILALKSLQEIQAAARADPAHEEDATARARRLKDSARERLRLWGITEEQIAGLDKSRKAETHLTIYSPIAGVVIKKEIHAGHYVVTGEDPYTIADDAVVWLQAEVFERDIGLVEVGQVIEIATESYPGESFYGTVAFINPQLQVETRTLSVRADVENRDGRLKPGMFATAVLRIPIGERVETGEESAGAAAPGDAPRESAVPALAATEWLCPLHPGNASSEKGRCPDCGKEMKRYRHERVLAVPVSAVIDTGSRKVVFLERGQGVFEAVEVMLGPRAGDYYQLLKGLNAGDRVVTAGAFLLDAESRLNPAAGAAYFGAGGHEGHGGHK